MSECVPVCARWLSACGATSSGRCRCPATERSRVKRAKERTRGREETTARNDDHCFRSMARLSFPSSHPHSLMPGRPVAVLQSAVAVVMRACMSCDGNCCNRRCCPRQSLPPSFHSSRPLILVHSVCILLSFSRTRLSSAAAATSGHYRKSCSGYEYYDYYYET